MVTIVAGPGFGKTALLALATTDTSPAGSVQVWLSCEPADESAEHLLAGLAHALELPAGADERAVLDNVWSRAPYDVCLMFDDVHEISPGSSGAALLARLSNDLAANGHLVFASRDKIPIPLARVAASGELIRINESDLVFDEAEMAAFATANEVAPNLLASTGGWPALAELTVSAGADMVLDYLWEEILARVGADRARLLAGLDAVGGGDDEVASALAGRSITVDSVVRSVPLVARSENGWAVLHPLWSPALAGSLSADDANRARCEVAAVHRRNGRYNAAVTLLVEAEAWDEVLEVISDAEQRSSISAPGVLMDPREADLPEFDLWHRALPMTWRDAPEAKLAAGLVLQGHAPLEALAMFKAAADGFHTKGDIDGELAAISHEALVRYWTNDIGALLALYQRIQELAAAGWPRARALEAVGTALLGHVQGQSALVLTSLEGLENSGDRSWLSGVRWMRSVAHRRNGDLNRALSELDGVRDPFALADPQLKVARLRIQWLQGELDDVLDGLADQYRTYVRTGDRFLIREIGLELAAKLAWIGDIERARELLSSTPKLPDLVNVLSHVLEVITRSAIAIGEGDEAAAAELLQHEALEGPAALGLPTSWFWPDRAAIAPIYVLAPMTRAVWENEPLGAAHLAGLRLAVAFAAMRDGDLENVRSLTWPEVGILRVNLPVRWLVELAVAGTAVGNPPPDDLLRAIGERGTTALRSLAVRQGPGPLAATASRLAGQTPVAPPYRLRIGVLGPLTLWRDGERSATPELRRVRVRELICYLIVHGRARREQVEEALWPDVDDPAHNLRVTLSYVQQALQPGRPRGERPYFLEATGDWLGLNTDGRLEVDSIELETCLDEADRAERSGDIASAIETYVSILPLWRGEPFADAPYAMWAEPARARCRARYVAAAIRVGELKLTGRSPADARHAAHQALVANPVSEPAHRLLIRAHVASDDLGGAREALQHCRAALADLGVEPDATTVSLAEAIALHHGQ